MQKININLLLIFLIIPFLEPYILGTMDINKVFIVLKLISTLLILMVYLKKNKFRVSKIFLNLLIYHGIIVISTIINHGDIIDIIGDSLAIIDVCMIIDMSLNLNKNKKVIMFVRNVFLIYSIINLIHVLIKFDGTDTNNEFLLGMDNRFIFYFLPMICFSILLEEKDKKYTKYITLLCFAISFFSLIYTWSVGALCGITLYFIYYLMILNKNCNNEKILNFRNGFIFICLLNVLIIFFNIQVSFSWLIEDLLHKDVGLTGRVNLWNVGIQKIEEKPLLGYGVNKEYLKLYLWGLNHYHNYFLNIIYQGGIIGFSLFIIMNIITGKKIMRFKENKFAKTIMATILISLILSLVDTLDYPFFYVFYIIGYNIDKFIIKKDEERKWIE